MYKIGIRTAEINLQMKHKDSGDSCANEALEQW